MTVEGGLMTGVVEPCQPIIQFMNERRETWDEGSLVYPDDSAHYERVIDINLDEVALTVATPGDSRNRSSLNELTSVEIQNVVIASCTGGSLADLRATADILRGRELKEGVRLTVTPSSTLVAMQAKKEG